MVYLAYECYPLVPDVDFSQITLPPIEAEQVTEEQIQEILEGIQKAHADWETITDRAVQEGDFVKVSIDSIEQDPPQAIVTHKQFEVSLKHLPQWLMTLLIGRHPGESVEGISEIAPDAEEATLAAFRPTKVRIQIHAIEKILPLPIDDALASKLGFESIEAVKNKIRQNLEGDAESTKVSKQLEALDKALLEKYPFDVPASLLNTQQKEGGMLSREALQLDFLCQRIVQQGSLSISQEELNTAISQHFQYNPLLRERLTKQETTRQWVSQVAKDLLQYKAKRYALLKIQGS